MSDEEQAPPAPDPFTPEQRKELLALVRDDGLVDNLAEAASWHRAWRETPQLRDAQITKRLRQIEKAFAAALGSISSLPAGIAFPLAIGVWGLRNARAAQLDELSRSLDHFRTGIAKTLSERQASASRPGRRGESGVDLLCSLVVAMLASFKIEGRAKVHRVLDVVLLAGGEDSDALERYLERRRKAAARRRTNPRD